MDWSDFLIPPEHLPPVTRFPLYGTYHLSWLAVIAAVTLICCWWCRRRGEYAWRRFLKGTALLIIAQEILKDVFIIWVGGRFVEHFPLHLCGLSVFICYRAAFRPTPFSQELIYCLTLPGALAALLFCDWTQCPPLNLMCWHSFSIHGYMVLFALVQLAAGGVRPNWRMLPRCFLWLAGVAAPIYLFNKLFNTNFLFMSVPPGGSPLVLLDKLFGNPGYIFATGGLVVAVWVVMYLPWGLANRHKKMDKMLIMQ